MGRSSWRALANGPHGVLDERRHLVVRRVTEGCAEGDRAQRRGRSGILDARAEILAAEHGGGVEWAREL